MDKIYKLLRSNKQTGPYTPEELVQLGLKPFDLIWADGVTAGWMYPSEIEVFKPYMAEEKKEPVKAAESIPVPDTNTSSTLAGQAITPVATAEKKTATPSSAKHIFISMPAGTTIMKAAPVQRAAVPDPAEEETPEQKLERKAMELRKKVQALAEIKKAEGEELTLDTKYARSLDDIKEEYTHWMHEQKRKGHGLRLTKKQWLMAALVLVLAGTGYTIKRILTPSASRPNLAVSQPPATLPVQASNKTSKPEEPNTQSVINTDYKERNAEMLEELEQANRQIEKDLQRYAEKRNTVASAPKTKRSVEADSPETYDIYDETPAIDTYEAKKTEPSRPVSTEARTVAYRTEKKAVPLSQQITIKAKYLWTRRRLGLSGLELALQNNSSQVLKTVAIDVFYYKDDRLLDKETVYFNDVQPGESLTLTAPGNKRASSATYQLGLISTQAGLYVAKQ